MFTRDLPIRFFAFVGTALAVAAPLNAQLAAKSPFSPAQAAAGNAPTPGAPLEFRAVMTTSEGTIYRIYDPAKKAGVWVKANERNPELEVVAKQYDEGQGTLTIEYQGKTITLAERQSKVVSSGTAGQAMPPPVVAQTNVPPAVTQSVVLNPTPADEQRRLDAVAAEVARRRALREQATQQMTQGGPQVAAPQPAQPVAQPQRGMQTLPQQQQQGGPNYQRPRGPEQNNIRQR